jgi:hypothetical protein
MPTLSALVRSTLYLLALGASADLRAADLLAADLPAADLPAADRGAGAIELAELPSAPRWSASYDVSKTDYRWSLGRGALDLGMRFEARDSALRLPEARFEGVTPGAPLVADLPALSIGLRSLSVRSEGAAGNLVERTLGSGGIETYVRKVGIEWKPAQSRLFLNRGLGIRLDGDDRVTVRMRKGSLGLYMQSNF